MPPLLTDKLTAYSYEPKDSVEAHDLFNDGVGGAAAVVLRLIFTSWDVPSTERWARLGVLQRVLELDFAVPKAAVYTATHDVRDLLKDDAWLAAWREPEKVRGVLKAMGVAFTAIKTRQPFLLRRETLLPPKVLARIRPDLTKKQATRLSALALRTNMSRRMRSGLD